MTEANVLARLLKAGYTVSIPFGNARYDFIVDNGTGLKRLQAKTGRIVSGTVVFNTTTTACSRTKRLNKTYHGEIDAFIVFCPENEKFYWVPIEVIPNKRDARLRLIPAKNGQLSRTRTAADFEFMPS